MTDCVLHAFARPASGRAFFSCLRPGLIFLPESGRLSIVGASHVSAPTFLGGASLMDLNMVRIIRLAFAGLFCVVVFGCGAGTGGVATPDAGAPVRNVGVEFRIRQALDDLRARNHLSALAEDARLEAVARDHALYCLGIGDVRHHGRNGEDVGGRLDAAGIDFREAGEILGRDRLSADPAESLFREWMRSPSHRREMVHPSFTRVGIAVVEQGGSMYAAVIFLNP